MPIRLPDETEIGFGACADGKFLKRVGGDFVGADPGAGGPHTHAPEDITGTAVVTADSRLSDARTPTAHAHPTSDVTGLDAALSGKASTGHNHDGAYSAAGHNHAGSYDPAGSAAAAQAASQPLDAELSAIAGLTSAADRVPYFTGLGTAALAVLTSAGRSLVAAVDAAAARVVLGLGGAAVLNVGTAPGTVAAGDHTHVGGSDPFETFKGALANDVSTGANVTPVDVTGLVFNFVANGKYLVEVFGAGRSAAATTGWGMQLNTSVAVTSVWMQFQHQLANTGTLSGGSSIADDASVGVSSGIPSANTDCPFYASGVLIAGANPGTAQLRWRSEVAAVSTVRAGTMMRVQRIA